MPFTENPPSVDGPDRDVIVVGAGIGGLYALYRMRELGADVRLLEATDGLGGTWHRNRYPGCRFDSESYSYGYMFSREIFDDWSWGEMFAPQPETLSYLNHVADRLDLRRDIDFDSPVTAAHFDESRSLWSVTVAGGRVLTARFLITALGVLSMPTSPSYEGADTFAGRQFHTIEWPQDLDLTGKRVAVIGTGSSGVQVISEIADKVAELTVFQLRPGWCAPLVNRTIDEAEQRQVHAAFDEIRRRCRESPSGFIHAPDRRKTFEVPEEERLAFWEDLYQAPGMGIWLGNFIDTLMHEDANAELSRFVADKIRDRVEDPEVAELLVPKDHGFGTQRVALETNYYEAYNRPNVHLVDLLETPVVRLDRDGIETTDSRFDVDVIVYATGFDAFTGPYDQIDIVGVDGARLRDRWADGPVTCYGVQVAGFPNLLMVGGPQGGSGSTNVPRGLEEIVDWIAELLAHMRSGGLDFVEATAEAEEKWVEHVRDVSTMLLVSKAKSWFTGYNPNIDRDPSPRLLIYAGGNLRFRARLDEESADGYPSFRLKASQGYRERSSWAKSGSA
jgi:cation diffusion facilitator CzcD-associated flavoprotein CzcO